MGEVKFVDMRQCSQLIERQVFFEVVINIAAHQIAFSGRADGRSGWGKRKVLPSPQALQDNFQQAAANLVAARQSGAAFLNEHTKTAADAVLACAQVQQQAAIRVSGCFEPFHAQHDVFHWAAALAGFRMRNACVYGDQVIDGYGETFLPYLEHAVPAGNEKQFGAGMGMQGRVPFLAVLSACDIEQLCPCVYCRGIGQDILMGAHGAFPP